jgi:hypothetical protein
MEELLPTLVIIDLWIWLACVNIRTVVHWAVLGIGTPLFYFLFLGSGDLFYVLTDSEFIYEHKLDRLKVPLASIVSVERVRRRWRHKRGVSYLFLRLQKPKKVENFELLFDDGVSEFLDELKKRAPHVQINT